MFLRSTQAQNIKKLITRQLVYYSFASGNTSGVASLEAPLPFLVDYHSRPIQRCDEKAKKTNRNVIYVTVSPSD